ncbi:FxsA family protein [Cucumibacter marinus]|uniref:FxsA family protein n=1 Tax=Cucumibacter marinus TaxID=1121252 RepID=UPI000422B04B|nr:FxsA family protein [Cucumibacter marinus]
MARYLFALFIIVPVIEIALFVLLGDLIGFWPTMGGVVLTAIIGSLLLRWQGFKVFERIQTALAQGQFPATPIVDGVMLAVAGALLLTPGFFTDAIGFLLFVPQVRRALFKFLRSRITVSAYRASGPGGYSGGFSGSFSTGSGPRPGAANQDAPPRGTIDLEEDQWRREDDEDDSDRRQR